MQVSKAKINSVLKTVGKVVGGILSIITLKTIANSLDIPVSLSINDENEKAKREHRDYIYSYSYSDDAVKYNSFCDCADSVGEQAIKSIMNYAENMTSDFTITSTAKDIYDIAKEYPFDEDVIKAAVNALGILTKRVKSDFHKREILGYIKKIAVF